MRFRRGDWLLVLGVALAVYGLFILHRIEGNILMPLYKITERELCPDQIDNAINQTTSSLLLNVRLQLPRYTHQNKLPLEEQRLYMQLAKAGLKPGGRWTPKHCISRQKVALVIPYRDRYWHLILFLRNIIPILQKQMIDFQIIVTEQHGKALFNKGRIMNAAFQVAVKAGVDCVIFHDVDLVPETDDNMYLCTENPRHLAPYVDTLQYKLMYYYLVGGAFAITAEHFMLVNGYSNEFWGWGGEDDDMGMRVLSHGFDISRPDERRGRYFMLPHEKRSASDDKFIRELLNNTAARVPTDGLSKEMWTILRHQATPLFTHILVDVGEMPQGWRKHLDAYEPVPRTQVWSADVCEEKHGAAVATIFHDTRTTTTTTTHQPTTVAGNG